MSVASPIDMVRWLPLLIVVLPATGCGRSEFVPSAPAPASSAACPLGVPGARVDAIDSPEGVDLRITAPADRVDEVRHRARDAAQLHGIGAHQGLGHEGKHLGAQRHGLRLTELPPIRTMVEDVDGGAQIALVARLPEQVSDVRSFVRARVDVVNAGPCD
jgi:hypothetical protein